MLSLGRFASRLLLLDHLRRGALPLIPSQIPLLLPPPLRRAPSSAAPAWPPGRQRCCAPSLWSPRKRSHSWPVSWFWTQHEQLRAVVVEVFTGERDEGQPTAAWGEGDESSFAWALRYTDTLPVTQFETMDVLDVLDLWMRDKLSACQVSFVLLTHGSRAIQQPPLTPAFCPQPLLQITAVNK